MKRSLRVLACVVALTVVFTAMAMPVGAKTQEYTTSSKIQTKTSQGEENKALDKPKAKAALKEFVEKKRQGNGELAKPQSNDVTISITKPKMGSAFYIGTGPLKIRSVCEIEIFDYYDGYWSFGGIWDDKKEDFITYSEDDEYLDPDYITEMESDYHCPLQALSVSQRRYQVIEAVFYEDVDGEYQVKEMDEVSFNVKLAAPGKTGIRSIKSPKAKQIALTWSKSANATGYKIVCATNKSFTKDKKTINKGKVTKATISGLKKGKTYYVKVCGCRKANGGSSCSSYSATKTIKVK